MAIAAESIALEEDVSGPAGSAASALENLIVSFDRLRDAKGRFVSTTVSDSDLGAGIGEGLASAAASAEQVASIVEQMKASLNSAKPSVDEMAAGIERMNAAANTNGFGTQLDRVKLAESAINAELQKQLELEAKIATFNGERARQTEALEKQLAGMKTAAGVGLDTPQPQNDGIGRLAGQVVGITSMAALIMKAINLVERVAKEIAHLVEAGAEFAIDAASFREETIGAFETIAKTHEGAEKLYSQALGLAGKLNEDKDKVVAEFKRLASEGFGEEEIAKVAEAIANVEKGRSGGGAKFEKIIETLKATDKMNAGVLKQLAKLGFDEKDMIQRLMQVTHKTAAEVQAALKTSAINANDAIQAILGAEEDKFGGLAAKAGNTFEGLINKIKIFAFDMFSKVDIGPVKDALSNVFEALKANAPELTQAIKDIFGGLFEGLFGSFDKAHVGSTVKVIADVLRDIGKEIRAMVPAMQALVSGIQEGFEFGATAADALKAGLGDAGVTVADLVPVFKVLGEIIGFAVGSTVALWTVMLKLAAPILGVVDAVQELVGLMTGAGTSAGSMFAQGLIQGILSGIPGVVGAALNLAHAATDAVSTAHQTHSPSEVTTEKGVFFAGGLERGIDRGTPGVADAAARMAKRASEAVSPDAMAPSALAAKKAANDNGGGIATPSTSGSQSTSNVYHLTVQPHVTLPSGTTPEQAHALGATAGKAASDVTQAEMRAFFRRVAEER